MLTVVLLDLDLQKSRPTTEAEDVFADEIDRVLAGLQAVVAPVFTVH